MHRCSKETDIKLYTRTEMLPADWASLLPAGHFLQPDQLAVNETAQFPDIEFLYALVYKNGQPVAAAYFQVLSLKGKHVSKTAYGVLPRSLWAAFTGLVRPKLLVAGHLFRHDIRSFYALPALSAFDAYKVYKAAIDAAVSNT